MACAGRREAGVMGGVMSGKWSVALVNRDMPHV